LPPRLRLSSWGGRARGVCDPARDFQCVELVAVLGGFNLDNVLLPIADLTLKNPPLILGRFRPGGITG
jgi:hypothetical protein